MRSPSRNFRMRHARQVCAPWKRTGAPLADPCAKEPRREYSSFITYQYPVAALEPRPFPRETFHYRNRACAAQSRSRGDCAVNPRDASPTIDKSDIEIAAHGERMHIVAVGKHHHRVIGQATSHATQSSERRRGNHPSSPERRPPSVDHLARTCTTTHVASPASVQLNKSHEQFPSSFTAVADPAAPLSTSAQPRSFN